MVFLTHFQVLVSPNYCYNIINKVSEANEMKFNVANQIDFQSIYGAQLNECNAAEGIAAVIKLNFISRN